MSLFYFLLTNQNISVTSSFQERRKPHDVISSACENSRFSSLLTAGDVSPGGTSTTQRLKLHTDDINQRLHNNDLRHQYGISVANSQTFLLEKRSQRRGARRSGCFRRLWYHLHLRTPSQFHKISAQERGIKYPCYTAETIGRPNNICFRRTCWYAVETLLQSFPRIITPFH